MHILELLMLRGFDPKSRTKIVRHKDKRQDLEELLFAGQFDAYQQEQSRPVFDGCDRVVSCIGVGGSRARFLGVYSVGTRQMVRDVPKGNAALSTGDPDNYFYPLTKASGYEDLEERVVVDWGGAALAWHQWLTPETSKEVVEVLPKGFFRPFPGFLEFSLSHPELRRIVHNPEANREWCYRLESVGGVYLILDTRNGTQYVGSASGAGGLFGRWCAYAENGHGGNKRLMSLLNQDPGALVTLRYSILQTLPKAMTTKEVIAHENLLKQKLGTRAHGLNAN